MDRFAAAHSTRYEELLEKARTDKDIPGFFDMVFGNESSWKKDPSKEQIESAVRFSSELIEFIFTVCNQLDLVLPEKRNHPYAQGWSRIFKKWAKLTLSERAGKGTATLIRRASSVSHRVMLSDCQVVKRSGYQKSFAAEATSTVVVAVVTTLFTFSVGMSALAGFGALNYELFLRRPTGGYQFLFFFLRQTQSK